VPLASKSIVINGRKYGYTMQPLTPATELLSLVSRIIEGPATSIAKGIKSFDSLGDLNLGDVISALLSKIGSSEEVKELITRVNAGGEIYPPKSTTPVSLAAHAEEHFREHFGDLVPWMKFALGVQLGPFGNSILSLFGLDVAKAMKLAEGFAKLKTAALNSNSPQASASDGTSSDSQSSSA
jgi:hypothetical protein